MRGASKRDIEFQSSGEEEGRNERSDGERKKNMQPLGVEKKREA